MGVSANAISDGFKGPSDVACVRAACWMHGLFASRHHERRDQETGSMESKRKEKGLKKD